jgi:hypothetical protein
MTSKNEYFTKQITSGNTLRKLILVSLLAMATATAVNLGLYAFVSYLFPYVAAWTGSSPTHIVIATIVYLTLATLVFAVVRRRSSRPARHYLIVATISLLLSLGQPIMLGFGPGLPGVPPADPTIAITLGLMHVISYAISVPLFIRMALD